MKTASLLFLLLVSAVSLHAEKMKLSRVQASELFVALSKIENGLAPGNAVTAADNINELRPVVEALDKGKLAAQRQVNALPASEDRQVKAQAIVDSLEVKALEVETLDLTRIDLTPDEIAAAKIPPRDLAVIRQHLKPKK